MQTTGAALLVLSQRSLRRMWLPAQDGHSARGLLYLTALWDDWHEQEHCQGGSDIDLASLAVREVVGRQRRYLRGGRLR